MLGNENWNWKEFIEENPPERLSIILSEEIHFLLGDLLSETSNVYWHLYYLEVTTGKETQKTIFELMDNVLDNKKALDFKEIFGILERSGLKEGLNQVVPQALNS